MAYSESVARVKGRGFDREGFVNHPEYERHKSYYDFWMLISTIPGLFLVLIAFPVGLLASWFYVGLKAGWDVQVIANSTVERTNPDSTEKPTEAKP